MPNQPRPGRVRLDIYLTPEQLRKLENLAAYTPAQPGRAGGYRLAVYRTVQDAIGEPWDEDPHDRQSRAAGGAKNPAQRKQTRNGGASK